MQIAAAQADLRRAYAGGAPGVLVSGLVWLVTGAALALRPVETAFLVLFLGGMAIFPASVALSRLALKAAPVDKANRLDRLGLESTFILFAAALIAWSLLPIAAAMAIPAFATLVGVRYFVFATLYDDRIYWVLGGIIATIGALFLRGLTLPINVALCVGIVELVFAAVIFTRRHRTA